MRIAPRAAHGARRHTSARHAQPSSQHLLPSAVLLQSNYAIFVPALPWCAIGYCIQSMSHDGRSSAPATMTPWIHHICVVLSDICVMFPTARIHELHQPQWGIVCQKVPAISCRFDLGMRLGFASWIRGPVARAKGTAKARRSRQPRWFAMKVSVRDQANSAAWRWCASGRCSFIKPCFAA